MLKNIRLERPLAVIDLETTGIDPKVDRIIEISVLKLTPDGGADHRTRRVNPGVPIPPEASAIHGITDDDVAEMPSFRGSPRVFPNSWMAVTSQVSTFLTMT